MATATEPKRKTTRTRMAAIVFEHGITQRKLAERIGALCTEDNAEFVRDERWLSKVLRGELRLWADDAVRLQRAIKDMTGTRYSVAALLGMAEVPGEASNE